MARGAAKNETIMLENNQRDKKDLGTYEHDGNEYHVVLGSQDDRDGAPDAGPGLWSKDFPNPVQEIPAGVFDQMQKRAAITAWIEDKSIRVYNAR